MPNVADLDRLFNAYPVGGWAEWDDSQKRGHVLASLLVFAERTKSISQDGIEPFAEIIVAGYDSGVSDAALASQVRNSGERMKAAEIANIGLPARSQIGSEFYAILSPLGRENYKDVAVAMVSESRRRFNNRLRHALAFSEGSLVKLIAPPTCCAAQHDMRQLMERGKPARSVQHHLPFAWCDQISCKCNFTRVPSPALVKSKRVNSQVQKASGKIAKSLFQGLLKGLFK